MSIQKSTNQHPLLIAHRGGEFWTGRRANDFRYVTTSIKEGADIVEFDIRHYGSEYVVCHDRFISPCQGTLSEALKWVEGTTLYLDMKSGVDPCDVIAFVRSYSSNPVIVGSFNARHLLKVRHKYRHEANLIINLHNFGCHTSIPLARKINADWINPSYPFATKKLASNIQTSGFRFVPGGNPFSFLNEDNQLRYAHWGAHAISTFRIGEMRQSLTRLFEGR